MNNDSSKSELRKGFLILAVLQALAHKRLYTAEILKSLNATEFKTQEGTLYPLLSKLKRDGLIEHEWVESRSGPPRKYYRLTDAGEQYALDLTTYMVTLQHQLKSLATTERKV